MTPVGNGRPPNVSWEEMAWFTLVPLSVSAKLSPALDEWRYRGEYKDYLVPSQSCELCHEDGLRYHFRIINQLNRNRMWLGSECITHFGILAVDESGTLLGAEESAKMVQRDRRRMENEARMAHVLQSLDRLVAVDPRFSRADSLELKGSIGERGGLSPKQALDLMVRFRQHAVDVAPSAFKVSIRRDLDRAELVSMPEREIKQIWPCLSWSQRKLVDLG